MSSMQFEIAWNVIELVIKFCNKKEVRWVPWKSKYDGKPAAPETIGSLRMGEEIVEQRP